MNPSRFASGGGYATESTAATNAMTVGGSNAAWVAITSVNDWNGSTWSAGTSLAASRGLTMYRGNTDSGINCGGYTGTAIGTALNITQTWNGSSWTTKASMNNRRANGFGLGGTEDSAFANGGQDGSGGTQLFSCEEYDGSSNTWTTKTAAAFGGQGSMGDGNPDNYISSSGKDVSINPNTSVQTWNGSAWTTLAASADFPTAVYNYGCVCGVSDDTFMMGTNSTSTGTGVIYKFDGSTWTDSGSATTAPKYVGMGGDSSSAIICGQWTSGTSSSIYNGSTWATTSGLQTARSTSGTGATTST